jgi:PST family polysaccharide transporter
LVFCELAWGVVSLGLAWICVAFFGLNGAGIAFFGSYVFHVILVYPIVRRLSGFGWSSANIRTGLLFVSLIAVVFCGFYVLPVLWATTVGTLAAVLSSVYSIRVLIKLISLDEVPQPIRRLLVGFGVVPSK